jgi:hypothetical protein
MPEDPKSWMISVYCNTSDQNKLVRIAEVMSRAAVGLAMEGVNASVSINPLDEEIEEP